MANSKQARKRARQAVVRRTRNFSMRSMLRTAVRKVLRALDTGSYDASSAAYASAKPIIDRMASKAIIHRNKAARLKSRLNAKVKALHSA